VHVGKRKHASEGDEVEGDEVEEDEDMDVTTGK